jgi:hypothetical protein
VGDHIRGQEDADVLLDFFRRHVAVATDGAFPDSTHRPAPPPQVKWLVAGGKAFSLLIFIGMMAAFVLDLAA